ncbi:hypothetical protein ACX9NJ_23720 [Mycobacterium sp. ML2]
MISTAVAAGDLLNAIPSLWNAFRVPGAIALIIVGIVGAITSMHKGIAHAAGKLIGAIALAAIALGAVGLTVSLHETVNKNGGGIMSGGYGG